MVDHKSLLNGAESDLRRPGSDGARRLATQIIVHAKRADRWRYSSGPFKGSNRGRKG